MAQSRSPIFVVLPSGDLISLTSVRGLRHLPDGRIVLPGDDNTPVAIFDPTDFPEVDRDTCIRVIRELIVDVSRGVSVTIPDWLKGASR